MVRQKGSTKNAQGGLIAALDIGSSKICCAIAGRSPEGEVEILGLGQQAAEGMRSGVIVQMEALENSVLKAVHTAEEMVGETISRVFVNINSPHLLSQMLQTHVAIEGRSVAAPDVVQTIEHCKTHVGVQGREILHTLPVSYMLDEHEGITDPQGMFGHHLRARVHVLSVPVGAVQNLMTLVRRCHLDIADLVISPYAASLSTLVEDERKLGATLIDMGAGTTSIATFQDGQLVYSGCIPVGSHHITQDIARGLGAPMRHAERLKTLYGSALGAASDDRETIVVPQIGDEQNSYAQSIPRSALIRIVRPRIDEILELVSAALAQGPTVQRIVLTGGGSQLSGLAELVRQKFGAGVRVAKPAAMKGMHDTAGGPAFSVCAGLLLFALQEHNMFEGTQKRKGQIFGRMARWIQENL